jgi:hypothetical protein
MPAVLVNGSVNIIRLSVPLREFPALLAQHRVSDPTTPEVEALGAAYVAQGFRERDTPEFVRAVCKWGHYAGVGGKVLKRNPIKNIRARMRNAHVALQKDDPLTAITEVTQLKGLGVSFGSKHLKFLLPDRAVVLDSIISERLGYRRTPKDYVDFLRDCAAIRDILSSQGIVASADQPAWRVSDVEMAIFKSLNP